MAAMKREAKCECCRAEMKFDEGHYLEVVVVRQQAPSPIDLLLGGMSPEADEDKEEEKEEGAGGESLSPLALQQPMARLLCDRCAAFLQVGSDALEQARLRAMAWWRGALPREAVRLEARPCGLCGGKGDSGRLPCLLCGETGTVAVRSPAKKCATCNGTGKGFLSMHFGVGGTCSFCKGLGWQFDRRGETRQREAAAKQKRRLERPAGAEGGGDWDRPS